MIDYKEMSDDDIKLLCAKSIMNWEVVLFKDAANYENDSDICRKYRNNFCYVDSDMNQQFFTTYLFDEMPVDEFWNPTDPDSNQFDRYLMPKIRERLYGFIVKYGKWSTKIEVQISEDSNSFFNYSYLTMNHNEINRMKSIACLVAWDKLEEISS